MGKRDRERCRVERIVGRETRNGKRKASDPVARILIQSVTK